MKNYTQLTEAEHNQIYALKQAGHKKSAIASWPKQINYRSRIAAAVQRRKEKAQSRIFEKNMSCCQLES
jgi:hypothetical protein